MVVGEIIEERDLIIIGGGPGGYTAAIRAAQLGMEVMLIEKDQLGGVCLNEGCIPSKVFAKAASGLQSIDHFRSMGIKTGEPEIDVSELRHYASSVVSRLRKGVETLCRSNHIEVIQGVASFLSDDRISVERGMEFRVYRFKKAIIAAGAELVLSDELDFASGRVFHQRNVYQLEDLPEHVIVIGNDVISLEIAMSLKRFGSEISFVVEEQNFGFDEAINQELLRLLKKQKIKLYQSDGLPEVEGDVVRLMVKSKQGKVERLSASHVYVTAEMKPNLEALGIDRLGLAVSDEGFLLVDKTCKTTHPNIYAIGDITVGPSLAVKAIKQGKTAAEAIYGHKSEVDLTLMPVVAHTIPPISAIGLTEKEARDEGIDVATGVFPLSANGFAAISSETSGFVKLVIDQETEMIIGVHMIGSGAIELASTAAIGMEMTARTEDFLFPVYPHPSYNEALLEAVEAITQQAIHLPKSPQKVKSHT